MARRGLLFAMVLTLAAGIGVPTARGGDGPAMTLGDHGEKALESLPWPVTVLRANLSKQNPVAISACYLMSRQLLVVTNAGRVYCLDRRNLQPRWVNSLRYPLAQPPAEGAGYYGFLMKDARGAHWVTAISKRSGAAGSPFPVRLPYSASSGIAVGNSLLFVGSLGSLRNAKTVESVNLLTGRPGWGYHTTGILFGAPQLDPGGDVLVVADDEGVVTSMAASATAPSRETWMRDVGGAVKAAPAVTPESVLVGNDDGLLYSLDLFSGKVNWLRGLDQRIRTSPWTIGGYVTTEKSTGVEGASPIQVKRYEGLCFARNVKGLFALDLRTGRDLFHDVHGGRPLCRQGKMVATIDGSRMVTFRDSRRGYDVTGHLNLGMFDLVPTNTSNGEIFGCTADGSIVAAIPK